MKNTSQPVLLTFIKNPELGKVKTRLAKTVGDHKALRIYKSLMQHTRVICASIEAKRLLFYSESINSGDDWPVSTFEKQLQANGDLGDRMAAAFSKGFEIGSPVIIIGSDCPGLSKHIIDAAFELLKEKDFVIGPAFDGGYYLLGMQNFEPSVFSNVEWSSASVKSKTIEIIEKMNKSYGELETLSDIDYEEDWIKYGWDID